MIDIKAILNNYVVEIMVISMENEMGKSSSNSSHLYCIPFTLMPLEKARACLFSSCDKEIQNWLHIAHAQTIKHKSILCIKVWVRLNWPSTSCPEPHPYQSNQEGMWRGCVLTYTTSYSHTQKNSSPSLKIDGNKRWL